MTQPSAPNAPKQAIYYGWYMVTIACLSGMLAAGISQLYMGSILPAIIADTGWKHSAVTGALAAGTILGGLLAPVAGAAADRYGPRLPVTIGALVLAAGYVAMGLSYSLVMFYVGYCTARMAAQGALGASVVRTIPVNWFRRKRGRAMGIVMMAVPIGAASSAMIGQWALLHGFSWRQVAFGMAATTLVLVALPAALFIRKSPESLGLLPDGDHHPEKSNDNQTRDSSRKSADEYPWSLRLALKTASLRLLIVASVLGITANGAVVFYHVTYLVSKGIPQVSAVTTVSALALAGALANLVWGILSERYSERVLAICSQIGAAVLIQGMLWVDTFSSALLLAMVLGIVVRGESSLTSLLIAAYFGRAAYGRIAGFMTTFQLFGLGAGPLIASMIYDFSHSFTLVYGAIGATYAAAALTFFLARPPKEPALQDRKHQRHAEQ